VTLHPTSGKVGSGTPEGCDAPSGRVTGGAGQSHSVGLLEDVLIGIRVGKSIGGEELVLDFGNKVAFSAKEALVSVAVLDCPSDGSLSRDLGSLDNARESLVDGRRSDGSNEVARVWSDR